MEKVSNPFSLMYGKRPKQTIERMNDMNTVIDAFTSDDPSKMTYLITGLRGTGKTVLLRELAEKFESMDDWLVIDINPQSNILQSFSDKLDFLFKKYKFPFDWTLTLNLTTLSVSLCKGKETIRNPELIAEKYVEKAASKNMKILITIDEVSKTNDFKLFVNFYQSMIGKNYPVFMIMTGIRSNIDQLISDSAMTFLSRSPKLEIGPLNNRDIVFEYRSIFNIDLDTATELALLTKGYAFAYQVLGYLFFEKKEKVIDEKLLALYDKYLADNGYNTFWKELTSAEKTFCIALAESETQEVEDVRKRSNMNISNFNNYRARLLRKEIIVAKSYGYLEFTLPRFKEFVENKSERTKN